MAKTLLSERALINKINLALKKDWPHKDAHCVVSGLKQVSLPERNWEVTMTNTGGVVRHEEECQILRDRVLAAMVKEYDVKW